MIAQKKHQRAKLTQTRREGLRVIAQLIRETVTLDARRATHGASLYGTTAEQRKQMRSALHWIARLPQ